MNPPEVWNTPCGYVTASRGSAMQVGLNQLVIAAELE